MSANNTGGLNDPGRSGGFNSGGGNTGSNGAGGGNNFGSAYGRSGNGYGNPLYGAGAVPFNVPRRDQTLQDRQYGSRGGGMVGTGTNSSNGGRPAPMSGTPVRQARRTPTQVPQTYPTAPVPTGEFPPVPGEPPPSWTDDRYPGATSPQPEPGFGIQDPYQSAQGSFNTSLPGGSTWQGNQVNNPVSNAGAKGNYEGGGIAVGGRGYAGQYARGGMIPPGQFGMVGEAGPEFVTGPARVEPMGSEQGIQMLLQALMGRQ